MGEAILVMQKMPEKCADCDLHIFDRFDSGCHYCADNHLVIFDIQKKPVFCKLRPMPQRVYYGRDCSECEKFDDDTVLLTQYEKLDKKLSRFLNMDDGYQCGVADCIKVIQGNQS